MASKNSISEEGGKTSVSKRLHSGWKRGCCGLIFICLYEEINKRERGICIPPPRPPPRPHAGPASINLRPETMGLHLTEAGKISDIFFFSKKMKDTVNSD
jgi:hypothetical protein